MVIPIPNEEEGVPKIRYHELQKMTETCKKGDLKTIPSLHITLIWKALQEVMENFSNPKEVRDIKGN